MKTQAEIQKTIKEIILREFLPGEDESQITSQTPLVTSGVLESIATLRLIAILETDFQIEIQAHEVEPENFDTIERIALLVESKLKEGGSK